MSRLPEPLRTHFSAPCHCGSTAGAHGLGRGANQACGDALEAGVWLSAGRIERVAWHGRGCAAALACASFAAERLSGAPLETARAFDLVREVAAMGDLGPTQSHAVQLVARAWGEALSKAADSCQS